MKIFCVKVISFASFFNKCSIVNLRFNVFIPTKYTAIFREMSNYGVKILGKGYPFYGVTL